MTIPALEPVTVSVLVNAPLERAFAAFTAEMTSWWPLAEISLSKGEQVVVEERLGGEIYEVKDGVHRHWAQITAWEPPSRIAVSWEVNEEAPAATAWEATFVLVSGGTRVTLVHSGWEALGADAAETRASYDGGWVGVLGHYVAYVNG